MKNLFLISICTFCISSCFNGKSSEKPSLQDTIPKKDTVIIKEESTIEKGYYMLDKNQCLHTKVCPILDSLYQVRYIDTCDVCKLTDVFYCHHCFNKEEVDKIEKKIKDYNKANEKKVTKTEPDSTNTPQVFFTEEEKEAYKKELMKRRNAWNGYQYQPDSIK